MTAGVIDMWAPIVPVGEVMAHVAENFPEAMLGYLRVFYKTEPTLEAFRRRAAAVTLSLDDVLTALDAAGIARTLITGFDERTSAGKTFVANELVAPLAERHPDRFIASRAPTFCAECPRCGSWSTGCGSAASEVSASARS